MAQVRSSHKELAELRKSLAAAQEKSVAQSHRMADHLRGFRNRLDEVTEAEHSLSVYLISSLSLSHSLSRCPLR